MAKNRYSERHRQVEGRLKIMESINRKLYRVEIWALNDQINRNNWRFINLREHLGEFRDIPILTAYLKDGSVIGDGHNFEMKRDPRTGEKYASFTAAEAERIVGWVPKDADIRIEKEGEINWIVVQGYLWIWYARELVEKIARQGRMDVSIETVIVKEHKDGDVDVEEEYVILGITVLGDGVIPAVAGASIQTLAALRNSMENEILKAASYAQEKTRKENKTDKGANEKMIPTMKQLEDATRAFTGYTCVGISEDGNRLALLSGENTPCSYIRSDRDEGAVVMQRIKECGATVCFQTEEGEVATSLELVLNSLNTKVRGLEGEKNDLDAKVKSLSGELEAMKTREKARRLQAARDAIRAELARRNEARSEANRFSESICRELMERIENNEFTDMCDKDGNWTGDKAICAAVAALCMDEQTRMDKENAAREKHYISWGRNNSAKEQPQTIGEALAADSARE